MDMLFLRGIPGCGKTTLASLLESLMSPEQCITLSADDYFTDRKTGEYKFDPRQLRDAHTDCQARAKNALHFGIPLVIIHNTGTRERELEPYQELAQEHGYTFHSVIVENRHGASSVHDVPMHTINSMLNRFSIRLDPKKEKE